MLGMGLGAAAGGVAGRAGRWAAGAGVAVVTAAGLVGSTVLRPWVNVSVVAANDDAGQGWEALDQHRDAAAVGWLTDAARMGPRVASTWFNLGLARQRTGDPAAAAGAFARAHELDPDNPEFAAAAAVMRR